MFEDRKKFREAASAKAKRLASSKPDSKVDASSFTPYSDPAASDEQTGPKVTSRRRFKSGGKVEGAKAKHHAGSKPRSAGGKNWIQGAIKHPGALRKALHVKEGEKIPVKKLDKAAHSSNPTMAKRANLAKTLRSMHAKGGMVHDDVREDKKLIKSMVKPSAMKRARGGPTTDPYAENEGAGAVTNVPPPPKPKLRPEKKASGGSISTKKNLDGSQQYVRGSGPMDRINTLSKYQDKAAQDSERAFKRGDYSESNRLLKGKSSLDKAQDVEAADEMGSRITPFKRGGSAHPKSCGCAKCCGGSVGRKKRDMGGRTEDALKAAGTAGAMGKGLLPMGAAAALASKKKSGGAVAHGKGCKCKECYGGRVERKHGGKVAKGKTNIHINIHAGKDDNAAPAPAMPMGVRPPMAPPMGAPAGAPPAGGLPPHLLAALAAGRGPGGMPAPGGMPPRQFRRGGKVYSSAKDMDAGAGSGEGRLEKTEIAAKSHR